MVNINKDTAINVLGLAVLGAVGIIAGRLHERKVIGSQLADIRSNVEWQDGQIQMLKDVYTEDILDKE